MLSKEEIQVLIWLRMNAAMESCSAHHINHVEGQIRGLLTVLLDGKKPDTDGNSRRTLDLAGIPYTEVDGELEVEKEWFIERGCEVDGEDVRHPKLKEWL